MVLANNAKSHANTLRVRQALYGIDMEFLILLFAFSWGVAYVLLKLIHKYANSYKRQKLAVAKAVFLTPTIAVGHGIVPVPVWYPVWHISNYDSTVLYISAFLVIAAFLFFYSIEKVR